jgi:hypothetical protein
MIASDLRIIVRNRAWYIVSTTTGATIGGPYTRSDEVIKARQVASEAETRELGERTRRRAGDYQRELEGLNTELANVRTAR